MVMSCRDAVNEDGQQGHFLETSHCYGGQVSDFLQFSMEGSSLSFAILVAIFHQLNVHTVHDMC